MDGHKLDMLVHTILPILAGKDKALSVGHRKKNLNLMRSWALLRFRLDSKQNSKDY